jgi:hypothetical protein
VKAEGEGLNARRQLQTLDYFTQLLLRPQSMDEADVAAIGDNPSLRARSRDPKVVLLTLDSINGDAWIVGAKGGPTDIHDLVGKSVTAPQAVQTIVSGAGVSDAPQ